MNCSMVEKKVVSKSLMLSFNCKVGLTVLTHRAVTDAHRYEQAVTSLRKHLRGLTCYCLWSLLWLFPPQSYPLSQNKLPNSAFHLVALEDWRDKGHQGRKHPETQDPSCVSSDLCTCLWHGGMSYFPFSPLGDPLQKE